MFGMVSAAAMTAACSGDGPSAKRATNPPQTEFNAEAKRAARSLSIGNRGDLLQAGSQYEKTVLCDLAITSAVSQLAASGVLDAAQRDALRALKTSFEQRIRSLARAENRADNLIEADRARLSQTIADPKLRMQYALGCLRQFGATVAPE